MNEQVNGYFDDGGTPLNPDLAAKPSLCVICKHDDDAKQEIICNLTRADQQDEAEFRCDSFEAE